MLCRLNFPFLMSDSLVRNVKSLLIPLSLVSASFETVLYNGNNATCCMFMMAVFGLRLRTRYAVLAR